MRKDQIDATHSKDFAVVVGCRAHKLSIAHDLPDISPEPEALMDHTPPPANQSPRVYSAPTRGFAVASVSLGYFSMIVFFWKPFGLHLASIGFLLGVIALLMGNRGSLRGEGNMAWLGTLICAFSLGTTTAVYKTLGFVQWDMQSLWMLHF